MENVNTKITSKTYREKLYAIHVNPNSPEQHCTRMGAPASWPGWAASLYEAGWRIYSNPDPKK